MSSAYTAIRNDTSLWKKKKCQKYHFKGQRKGKGKKGTGKREWGRERQREKGKVVKWNSDIFCL